MGNPLVSVVTAAYNTRLEYLLKAIRSALSQTWEDLEIIVSDDSPDASLEQPVRRLAETRIRYRHNSPALGVALNHWACLREARGKYVTILNHDDWFAATFVERLAGPLELHPECAVAFCDHWVADSEGRVLPDETEINSERWKRAGLSEGVYRPFYHLVAANAVPTAMAAVFRREVLPEDLPEAAGPAYDLWLAYCLCREGLGAYYVRDRLSTWRRHPSNLTARGGSAFPSGSALCWIAIAGDRRLASVRRVAKRNAALALRSCALASWQEGRRWGCLRCGLRSLGFGPTWKGLAACLLPLTPKPVALRLVRHHTGRSGPE